MEIWLRLILFIIKVVALFVIPLQCIFVQSRRRRRSAVALPPISDPLLTLSLQELRKRLRTGQLSAVELVGAYIARIEAVNPLLNAVIEDRFGAALSEAAAVDDLLAEHSADLDRLFKEQPLLGLPVTVKESCALSGMSFAVGSLKRSGQRAPVDGAAVARLRAAGAIPLLVSATPEYCYSIETATLANGRCRNPYDLARTPGGSSGGEGALIGAGASLFGVGSDIAGSIRIPSLFCGIFGHKPTGGLVDVAGHFPDSSDADFAHYLQLGPMSRFAADLAELLQLMAGDNAAKLQLHQPVQLQQLKVYYGLGFEGLNGWLHQSVDVTIVAVMRQALAHFREQGLQVEHVQLPGFEHSLEISLSSIARLNHMPFLMQPETTVWQTLAEYLRSLLGRSRYTTNALTFDLMRRSYGFMPQQQLPRYQREAQVLSEQLTRLLGEDGVMLFPTLHTPAALSKWTLLPLWGIDYTLIFNILGMPVTHVPMGVNEKGLPIGFSVIAAPFQDRLCLSVAVELERAFGGWQPPTPHKLNH